MSEESAHDVAMRHLIRTPEDRAALERRVTELLARNEQLTADEQRLVAEHEADEAAGVGHTERTNSVEEFLQELDQ